MKAKTIKSIISKKINQWLETIEDENLRKKLEKSVIVTGGSIVSLLTDEPVHDFDIYLRDMEAVIAVSQYYVERFKSRTQKGIEVPLFVEVDKDGRVRIVAKSAGVVSADGSEVPYQYFENSAEGESQDYINSVIDNPETIADVYEETEDLVQETKGKGKYNPVFLTSNAITLSDKIQIVIRFYGDPEVIHENYDYVHCTSYWTSWDNNLVLRPEALEAILAKELRYVGSKYPICSLVRLRKFIKRGWSINAGQILKISMQISKLNLEDLNVLQDQLIGVDTAYFVQIIESLKAKDPEKVNVAYLTEIIDRLF